MKKSILIIGAIAIASILLVGCTRVDTPRILEQQFYEGEKNLITFPEWAITACDNNSIEDVFESVYDYLSVIFCYDDSGKLRSWVKGEPHNWFDTIDSGREYTVIVNLDCNLIISE